MFWLVFAPLLAASQGTTDEQLAAYYYREGDFEKAQIYYDNLYDKNGSDENYEYLLKSLLAIEEFRSAQKLAEQHSKAHPNSYEFQIDIGRVLLRAGEEDKANKHFDKVIKSLDKASVNQILSAGRAFTEINDNARALEVYSRGRKQMGNSYPFHFQIAQVKGQMGDIEGMVTEYLDVLEVSTGYIQSVQNTLNRVIGFEENNKYNEILLNELTKRVQKNPDNDIYAEMLVWIFMQQNKYDGALIQVMALDKKNKEDGERVIELANIALNAFQYKTAIQAFEYVKGKGPRSYYYLDAMFGLLRASKAKVTSGHYTESDIEALVTAYKDALDEIGVTSRSAPILNDFAHTKAFYQSKYSNTAISEAIDLLQQGLNTPGLSPSSEAELKMQLADIQVLTGNIWDASLLYGQVEKKFKYDELGHSAKLKNALVFYYAGDFYWSQSQLDVLKGSTSKLISNDAVELSAFITENIGIDSNLEALSMFAKMELMVAQHKYDSALLQLDSIKMIFPGHELGDNILFQRGIIYTALSRYKEAAEAYLKIPEQYPFGILNDNAIMEAARLYEEKLEEKETAMNLYQLILTDYTNSLYTVEARKRYRLLRGDAIQ
ncbi:MAG: hypothetical protein Salg2KO_00460 [Salibacteraceae bacterium]